MNFTREPVIETVITPKEGCKLVIRSSKGASQEDYVVDAIEVVSFGTALFFRSQERPKSFIVPVGDYEVLELKETRMVLKNASVERSIKIGGGKETAKVKEEPSEEAPRKGRKRRSRKPLKNTASSQETPQQGSQEEILEENVPEEEKLETAPKEASVEASPSEEKPKKKTSFISKLFPPPPTLIQETLARYKEETDQNTQQDAPMDEPIPEAPEEEPPTEEQ